MNTGMAQAFQNGSGIDPGRLKAGILVGTATVTLLVFGWIITRLFQAWQDDHISAGEFLFEVFMLMAIFMFILFFIESY